MLNRKMSGSLMEDQYAPLIENVKANFLFKTPSLNLFKLSKGGEQRHGLLLLI